MLIAEQTMLYVVNNLNQAVDKQNLPEGKMENKKLYRILNQNNRYIGIISQYE